jgi:hypothetical protein
LFFIKLLNNFPSRRTTDCRYIGKLLTLAGTDRMFKRKRPYNLLGVTGLIMLLVSFLVPFQSVDIHVHDTYFVFEMSYAFRNISCFLLALISIYTFLQQMLYSILLTWVHTFLWILTTATCIFFLYRASQAFHTNFPIGHRFRQITLL